MRLRLPCPRFVPAAVLLSAVILAACAPPSDGARPRAPSTTLPSPETVERIARIERGLLPPVQIKNETVPWLIEERMRVHRVPGLVIAVFDDYRVVWIKGYGFADPSTGKPATETTLMQIGSISKSIASMLALQEVRAGNLALDADINTALTSWKLAQNDFTRRTPVTLRRLLSHTGGTNGEGFSGYPSDEPVPTLAQILDGKAPAKSPAVLVDLPPGSQFRYSGGGFLVVQQAIIDAEKGRTFPSIAAERVLAPLGMTHSTFEQPLPADRLKWAAAGHTLGKMVPGKHHTYPELASGGLWTTAGDLARFWIEIQRSLAGREALVPLEIATLMTTRVAAARPGQAVSLGTFLSKEGDAEYFGNHGTNTGFQATAIARKGKGYGAVLMANSVGSEELFAEVRRAIAREYAWDGFDAFRFERRKVDVAPFASFAGRWTLGQGRGFSLTVRDGRLAFRVPLEEAEELVPVDGDVFVGRATGVRVTFPSQSEVAVARGEGKPERASRIADDAAAPIFLLDAGREGEALVAYRKLLAANPNDPAATEGQLGGIASKLFRRQRFAETIRVLRLNAALYPDSTDAHESLAYVYDWMEQRAPALESYRAAIDAMNRDPKATPDAKSSFSARIARTIRRMAPP